LQKAVKAYVFVPIRNFWDQKNHTLTVKILKKNYLKLTTLKISWIYQPPKNIWPRSCQQEARVKTK